MFKNSKHYKGVMAIKQKEINIAKDKYLDARYDYFSSMEIMFKHANRDMVDLVAQKYSDYVKAYCRYCDLVAKFELLKASMGLKYYE